VFWDKYLSLFLQDPAIPEVSKNICKRMLLRCNGKTPNEINIIIPLTQNERKAYQYLGMVNADIMPENLFNNPAESYPTFWTYLQKADNNKTKELVLQ